MVPSVAITAMHRLREAATAASAPASITPMTGSVGWRARRAPSADAEAVLQATTRQRMRRATRAAAHCSE
jgi:hypothetical protein